MSIRLPEGRPICECFLANIHRDELNIEPMKVWNMGNEIHEIGQLPGLAFASPVERVHSP